MEKEPSAKLKAEIALEAARGQLGIQELASKYTISIHQIEQWKQHLIEHAHLAFPAELQKEHEKQIAQLQLRAAKFVDANYAIVKKLPATPWNENK
jgi:transposase-like protein